MVLDTILLWFGGASYSSVQEGPIRHWVAVEPCKEPWCACGDWRGRGMMSGGAHRADCWVPWCPVSSPSRLGAPAQRSTKNPTRLIAQMRAGDESPDSFWRRRAPTLGTLSVSSKIENAKCSVFGMHSSSLPSSLAIKVGGGGGGGRSEGRGDVRWLLQAVMPGRGRVGSSAFRCVGRPPLESPPLRLPSLLSAGPRRDVTPTAETWPLTLLEAGSGSAGHI